MILLLTRIVLTRLFCVRLAIFWRLWCILARNGLFLKIICFKGYCNGVKKIITRLSFNQNFQTISEFLAEIPVMKMRYWSLNLIILEGDRSNNIIQKPWNMAIFWVPLEIGCSKLGEFLLKETTYLIVPYIFFFSCEATLDNTQNVRPSVPWWLLEFSDF